MHEEATSPRWLKLAAAVRAEADPATLARVYARLAARSAEPAWLRWLARPAALATSAALLVLSAVAGSALLGDSPSASGEGTLAAAELLGEDGSYGLVIDEGEADDSASDSGRVAP